MAAPEGRVARYKVGATEGFGTQAALPPEAPPALAHHEAPRTSGRSVAERFGDLRGKLAVARGDHEIEDGRTGPRTMSGPHAVAVSAVDHLLAHVNLA